MHLDMVVCELVYTFRQLVLYTELVIGALPAEPEELVVWGNHSYMEVSIVEIHAGQPLQSPS